MTATGTRGELPSEVDRQRVEELERRLQLRIEDTVTALAALTHKSYVNEHRADGRIDNERLEFLGDAVIDLAVSHRLMERFPNAREGELSRLRAAVVNEEGLANVARALDLGSLLLLGRGEELTGGREKPSLLADALEAVIGAIYLSGGIDRVFHLVDRLFGEPLDRAAAGTIGRDYKTQLQELAQGRLGSQPRYRIIAESGPDHSKTFTVELEIAGEQFGRGEGRTKKDAEQNAAREALDVLGKSRERAARPTAKQEAPAAPAPVRRAASKAPAERAVEAPAESASAAPVEADGEEKPKSSRTRRRGGDAPTARKRGKKRAT